MAVDNSAFPATACLFLSYSSHSFHLTLFLSLSLSPPIHTVASSSDSLTTASTRNVTLHHCVYLDPSCLAMRLVTNQP